MIYERYKNRIAKLAQILKVLYRFRIAIISVLSAITVITAALLLMSGMVMSVSVEEFEISYGDKVEISANAFLSDVDFMFSADGGATWKDGLPEVPGEYKIKPYSYNAFGAKRYGKTQDITIKPRRIIISVEESEIVYGENPTVITVAENDGLSPTSLAQKDVIECETFRYNGLGAEDTETAESYSAALTGGTGLNGLLAVLNAYDDAGRAATSFSDNEVASVTVVPDESALKIFHIDADAKNEVTDYYEIVFEEKPITINKRSITIKIADETFIYDGTYKSANKYEIKFGSFVSGDIPDFKFVYVDKNIDNDEDKIVASFRNAGSYGVTAVCRKIISANGENVSRYYDIKFEFGSVTIDKLGVNISTANQSETYNGSEILYDKNNYVISADTPIPQNERIEFNDLSLIDVGRVSVNSTLIRVYDKEEKDGDGHDLETTGNYVFNFVGDTESVFEIVPKPITLRSHDLSWEYDGYLHSEDINAEYECEDTVFGHTVKVYGVLSEITNVSESGKDNECTFKIYDGDRDVSGNYSINVVYGTLTITPRPITIQSSDREKVYDGTAIFADNGYEIIAGSLADSEELEITFTNTETDAGTYGEGNTFDISIVKADGSNSTGNYEITRIYGTLEITPRPITITTHDLSWVYDGYSHSEDINAEYECEDTVFGHTVKVYEVLSEITNVSESGKDNECTFKIYNGDKDVSGNYSINVVYGTLTITPRPITIQSSDREKVYDGTAIFADNGYEIIAGSLADSEELEITFTNTETDAGTYEEGNTFDISIVKADGSNSTGNYEITRIYGTLEITPRPITITTHDLSWEYDGYSHHDTGTEEDNCLPYTNEGLVSDGHIISVDEYTEIIDAGSISNECTFKIYDGDKDVSGNYSIDVQCGTLTITPRPITITTHDLSWVYDGYLHHDTGTEEDNCLPYTNEGLVSDSHIITVDGYTEIIDAGSTSNECTFKIYDGDKDVSGNYSIDVQCGTLTITPRPITITTHDLSWVYDGYSHHDTGTEEDNCLPYTNEGLVSDSHIITVDEYTEITNVSESGKDNECTFKIYDGDKDVSGNYYIDVQCGTLTITQRPIEIKPVYMEKIYDGTALVSEEIEYSETDLVSGHEIVAYEITGLQTAAGESSSAIKENSVVIIDAVGNETTANYNIICGSNTLKVLKRPITIKPVDREKVYDGTALVAEEIEFLDDTSLADNQSIKVEYIGTQTDVGTSDSAIAEDSVVISDADETDVSENYIITCKTGTLEITPRQITVQSSDREKVYDGTAEFTDNGYEIIVGALVQGEELEITFTNTETDAGTYVNGNTFDISIVKADGSNSIGNYAITRIYGTLKITPRNITVYTGTEEFGYDGNAHYNHNYGLTENSQRLVVGHELYINADYSITDVIRDGHGVVISTDNTLSIDVKDSLTGESVGSNYAIECEYGTLKVNPRDIAITSYNVNKVYDGTADFADNGYNISAGSLANSEELEITFTNTETDVGTYENTFGISIVKADGSNSIFNYDISCVYGTLTITPRPITVQSSDREKVYDGTAIFADNGYEIIAGSLADSEELEITFTNTKIDVGTYVNGNTFDISIVKGDGSNSTGNYEITRIYGTLKITRRPITVRSLDVKKEYDGTPIFTDNGCEITAGSLANSEELEITFTNTETDVGTYVNGNTFDIKIVKADGSSSENNYDITCVYGNLTILKRNITLISDSDKKEYDGTPLTCNVYEAQARIDGTAPLLAGDEIVPTFTGSQTEVGWSDNTFTALITRGGSVADYYEIHYKYGTLTVIEPEAEDDGGGLNNDGTIAKQGTPPGESERADLYKVNSTVGGVFYFKSQSFGNYAGIKWKAASEYTAGDDNVLELTFNALQSGGKQTITIVKLEGSAPYVLPYFADFSANGITSDTVFNSDDVEYTLWFIPCNGDYAAYAAYVSDNAQLAAAEEAYRAFVYNNYLGLPESTLAVMNEIIAANDFGGTVAEKIARVAGFVRGYREYGDYEFDGDDIAVQFFDTNYTGKAICSHYATAATALFRALGIPARYTIGIAGEVQANTDSILKSPYHAWVEVYIDGFGWVPVEVTGSWDGGGGIPGGPSAGNGGGDEGGGEQPDNPELPENVLSIAIKPIDVIAEYTGEGIASVNQLENADRTAATDRFAMLLENGYTYECEVSGERLAGAGIGKTEIEIVWFRLYDEYKELVYDSEIGEDVQNNIYVEFEKGKIQATAPQIIIRLYTVEKVYDGEELAYDSDDYDIDKKPDFIESIEFELPWALTEPGKIDIDKIDEQINGEADAYGFKAFDKFGNKIDSSEYYVKFVGEPLTVRPIPIEVMTSSATFDYDGNEHRADSASDVWMSFGNLLDGHKLELVKFTGSQTDCGSSKNVAIVRVEDKNGNDVSRYYYIDYKYGMLTVEQNARTF